MKYSFEEFVEEEINKEDRKIMIFILIVLILMAIIACCFAIYYAKNVQTLYVITATGEEMTGHFILKHKSNSVWVRLEDGTMEQVVKYKIIVEFEL
mgnify:CR=1 FL=1